MPTIKLKEKLIKLINRDSKVRRCYIDEAGDTCVIGCLALNSGVEKEELRNDNGARISKYSMRSISRRIREKFGLTTEHLCELQTINDETPRLDTRRRKLVSFVKSI